MNKLYYHFYHGPTYLGWRSTLDFPLPIQQGDTIPIMTFNDGITLTHEIKADKVVEDGSFVRVYYQPLTWNQ